MAMKTNKKIKNQLERFDKCRIETLRRNSDFLKDYEEWFILNNTIDGYYDGYGPEEQQKRREESDRKRKEIEDKYQVMGLSDHYQDPNNPNNLILTTPDKPIFITYRHRLPAHYYPPNGYDEYGKDRKKYSEGSLGTLTCESWLKCMLKDSRFLTIRIDMYRDIDIILSQVKEMIQETKRDMKKYGLLKQPLDKIPRDFERYFAVWDMIRGKRKGWTYEIIIRQLKKQGFYKGQGIKQAISLARQDYKRACKLTETVKKIRKRSKRSLKPIMRGKVSAKDRADAQVWEEILTEEGLGINEIINRHGALVVRPSDGVTKKKMRDELREKQRLEIQGTNK